MKELRDIISSTATIEVVGATDYRIEALEYDSRRVEAGGCFFAVVGTASDGHNYIDAAIERGAVAVVCQRLPEHRRDEVTYIVVEDSNVAMADMAAAYYDHPSRELHLVGVTGTNGKTTTATLLYDMFMAMGRRAGLISTVVYRIGEERIASTHTTPDPIRLNAMMRRMVEAGCQYCFMEVSSHAAAQHRIRGLHFEGALFTNLTHDHLDYHGTYKEYIRAKKSFFDNLPKGAWAVTNIDDRNGEVMVQNTRAKVYRLSLRSMADYRCKLVEMLSDGMQLQLDGQELWVKFTGRFNAYNLTTVYAAATLLGIERMELLTTLSLLTPVRGRFESITAEDGTIAIIDYAHTPDALENVLVTIEEMRRAEQRLFVVCGCGGDRDRTKRPEMAAIAVRYATTAIFSSDNPRTEHPEAILDDMVAGVSGAKNYLRITDRREAIRTAAMLAHAGDIILIAGKGHEDYQIIGTEKHHFDDAEEARMAFATTHTTTKNS
ncbi:MAG: UDP-N-acetylmuramoyl-L-alanyl-D-glutamate--2,6-diaminopimelate ligase [Alistipes sp.]|nr:UDP-N-acetylmuramoyl-L-alanyl-D-glutamate--2,6-diaminopimelate ligase [Alistipes sp.]